MPYRDRRPSVRPLLVAYAGALFVLGAAAACGAPARGTSPPSPAPAEAVATRELPDNLFWVQHAAEYRALTRQAYAMAAAHLEDTVPTLAGRAWGVILDADETILDNSEYEQRRAQMDSVYTEPTWAVWVHEEAATEVPGASAFTREVRRLGGRLVVVSNRADSLCGPTLANLQRLGVTPDVVLCAQPGHSDKNLRFRSVQNGTASADLPALEIVEWIGDNIKDFPDLTQAARDDPSALARFGRMYFMLPNPVYGSWQTHPTP
jgi:5'-nucleotidase (lipoprotein e(P4) family)